MLSVVSVVSVVSEVVKMCASRYNLDYDECMREVAPLLDPLLDPLLNPLLEKVEQNFGFTFFLICFNFAQLFLKVG